MPSQFITTAFELMKILSKPIAYILTIGLLWFSFWTLQAQKPASSWTKHFENYYNHDHKGNRDTLIAYTWKAFHLARQNGSNKGQIAALGKFINTIDADSFKHYLAVLDTFPQTVQKVHIHAQLKLSYFRCLLAKMSEHEVHVLIEDIIQKADSVYADSLYDKNQPDAETIYLLYNRKYLSLLIEYVDIDSKDSPFYSYLTRFNTIVDRLPAKYSTTKLNSYLTSSEIYLEMNDYERAMQTSERVIEGILDMPNVPSDFQEMKMGQASIFYYMCYQQLCCYDHISEEMLTRNWAYINSPYGQECHDYLESFGGLDLTPKLYYDMATKKYQQVIAATEKKIQKFADRIDWRHLYVSLQNKAIRHSANPERYQDKLLRNFAYIKEHQAHSQEEKEIDYTNLFEINKLKQRIVSNQLNKEKNKVIWGYFQFAGVILILVLGICGIRIVYISNKRKQTLIKKLRAATRRNIEEKRQTEQAKMLQTICLDNMNHEIRSPLNSIVGFSELLLDNPDLDTETKQQFTDQIDTSSSMLLQIINDVLDTAQLESGQYTLQNEHLSVRELCQYAVQSMQYKLQPNVTMNVEHNLDIDTHIYADKTRLLQILINFLSNACKHTSQGHITLACSWTDTEKKNVRFTVTDTGCGIPADKQLYLFERFAKLNRKAQGTGLGLNIAATLAHVMNAQIGYDASYTKGARFYLEIPSGQDTP